MIKLTEIDTAVRDALQTRVAWEDRQITGYKLRHEGLGRAKKPWPRGCTLYQRFACNYE